MIDGRAWRMKLRKFSFFETVKFYGPLRTDRLRQRLSRRRQTVHGVEKGPVARQRPKVAGC